MQVNEHSDVALIRIFKPNILILEISSASLHSCLNAVYYAELMEDLPAYAITCDNFTYQFPSFSGCVSISRKDCILNTLEKN